MTEDRENEDVEGVDGENGDGWPITGRRDTPRLKLQIPAEVVTMSGPEPVLLLDLSQTGARIACRAKPAFKRGILHWMEFEFYGEVVWADKQLCALRFDPELELDVVLTTRAQAPAEWRRLTENVVEAARYWAAGLI